MKALRYILFSLLILVAAGLLVYQGLVAKNLTSSDLTRGLLIIVGALISMLKKPKNRKTINKKAEYQRAYPDFIREPFADQPKLEKKFYQAVDLFVNNKPDQALALLSKLKPECRNSQERYSITVFTALCLDDLKNYKAAIPFYEAARQMRNHSTLASNLGLDFQRTGQYARAQELYEEAIRLDPNNAATYNNLCVLYFFQGKYENALDAAREALKRNEKFPPALAHAAICCKMLGNEEDYNTYYRRAVAAGYNGDTIKKLIKKLDSSV